MKIQGKTVNIFKAENTDAPLVILNNYRKSNGAIYKKCKELGCPDFTLVEVSDLNWDDDMSPWAIPPISENDTPCGGKADEYLALLLNEIIPVVKSELIAEPRSVMLAGYSLAGLFALYAVTKCDLFTAVASCSGSMWFPDFMEYITKYDTTKLPRAIYFSLGDREAHTNNKILQTVEDHTRAIEKHLAEHGINTVFELNKGNHFQQGALRTAKGIKWILEESK